jgi:D-3-phosphoglycerate dehydrogenase
MKILIAIEQGSMQLDVSEWTRLAKVEYVATQDEATLIEQIVDADVLIPGWKVPITAKIIAAGKKLKMIQTFTVGYDKIDHIAATKKGIMVCNTGGSNAESVAELTWGLILGLFRRIPGGDRLMKAGKWGRFKADQQTLIWGKTLGIVGFGAIGRLVSKIGRLGFNMNLLAYDPYVIPETVEVFGGRLVSLETVMKESDVVSIHVPLSNATRHMISMRELQMMKSTAILVNTARGADIDEASLIQCLQKEVIAGAALDVFEVEPLPVDSPLRSMDNVIMVSHIGTCPEVFIKMRKAGIENVTRYLRGEKPMRIVNPSYIITSNSQS